MGRSDISLLPYGSLNCVYQQLAMDNGAHLCAHIHCAVIAAWLNYLKKSRGGVRMNMSSRKVTVKVM